MASGRTRAVLLVAAIVLIVLGGLLSREGDPAATTGTDAGAEPSASTIAEVSETADAPIRYSDLQTITIDELPPEAIDTLWLIADGGPFPFDRDDLVFQNREGLLPDHPLGHYREYTVITPGEDDRGARRVVAGDDGARYYTADHYASFREILLDGSGP